MKRWLRTPATARATAPSTRRRGAVLAAVVAVTVVVPGGAWAGHRFIDVPASSVFHEDIDWLADTGVTRGCNPPDNTRFCPSDPVTREQFAALLHRLDTEDVFVTPTDAASFDQRVAIATTTASAGLAAGDELSVSTLAITHPAAGTIAVEYSLQVVGNAKATTIITALRPQAAGCDLSTGTWYDAATAYFDVSDAGESNTMRGTAYLDVAGSGSQAFRLCVAATGGGATHRWSTLSATWHPSAAATSTGPQASTP